MVAVVVVESEVDVVWCVAAPFLTRVPDFPRLQHREKIKIASDKASFTAIG